MSSPSPSNLQASSCPLPLSILLSFQVLAMSLQLAGLWLSIASQHPPVIPSPRHLPPTCRPLAVHCLSTSSCHSKSSPSPSNLQASGCSLPLKIFLSFQVLAISLQLAGLWLSIASQHPPVIPSPRHLPPTCRPLAVHCLSTSSCHSKSSPSPSNLQASGCSLPLNILLSFQVLAISLQLAGLWLSIASQHPPVIPSPRHLPPTCRPLAVHCLSTSSCHSKSSPSLSNLKASGCRLSLSILLSFQVLAISLQLAGLWLFDCLSASSCHSKFSPRHLPPTCRPLAVHCLSTSSCHSKSSPSLSNLQASGCRLPLSILLSFQVLAISLQLAGLWLFIASQHPPVIPSLRHLSPTCRPLAVDCLSASSCHSKSSPSPSNLQASGCSLPLNILLSFQVLAINLQLAGFWLFIASQHPLVIPSPRHQPTTHRPLAVHCFSTSSCHSKSSPSTYNSQASGCSLPLNILLSFQVLAINLQLAGLRLSIASCYQSMWFAFVRVCSSPRLCRDTNKKIFVV